MNNNVFQRCEIKYLVDSRQYAMLEQAFREQMTPDPHGDSSICNVYFDTPDYRLIRASLEKPVYREKLRMRSYGQAEADGRVYLELKKKYHGVVYKRRISLSLQDAEAYMAGLAPLPEDSQIGRELDYFRRYHQGLRPSVYLSYERAAWYSREDPRFRATFDREIRWRGEDLTLLAPTGGELLLPPSLTLFEIKTPEAIPLWLVEILEAGQIRQTAFSKYGEAFKSICSERKGVSCA